MLFHCLFFNQHRYYDWSRNPHEIQCTIHKKRTLTKYTQKDKKKKKLTIKRFKTKVVNMRKFFSPSVTASEECQREEIGFVFFPAAATSFLTQFSLSLYLPAILSCVKHTSLTSQEPNIVWAGFFDRKRRWSFWWMSRRKRGRDITFYSNPLREPKSRDDNRKWKEKISRREVTSRQ